jgi:hypothetical protein
MSAQQPERADAFKVETRPRIVRSSCELPARRFILLRRLLLG